MEDRNGGAIMAIGGVLSIVILGAWVASIIKGVFIELGKTLDAFGVMMHSFVGFLWAMAQVAFLASLIVASVVAAIYFTYKYILMVKRATAIQQNVSAQLNSHGYELSEKLQAFEARVEGRLNYMGRALDEALKEPEAAPVIAQVTPTQALLPSNVGEDFEARDLTVTTEPVVTTNQGDLVPDMSAVSPTL